MSGCQQLDKCYPVRSFQTLQGHMPGDMHAPLAGLHLHMPERICRAVPSVAEQYKISPARVGVSGRQL